MIESDVKAINHNIDVFKNVPGSIDKDPLMNEIGIHVEIIEIGVFLSVQEKDIIFRDETKKAIKELFIRVRSLIHKLGKYDSDFGSISITKPATPNDDIMTYLKKNGKIMG